MDQTCCAPLQFYKYIYNISLNFIPHQYQEKVFCCSLLVIFRFTELIIELSRYETFSIKMPAK